MQGRFLPELPKLGDEILGSVADNNGGCDRTHRDSSDQVGSDAMGMEDLIGSRMIGTERIAPPRTRALSRCSDRVGANDICPTASDSEAYGGG